MYINIVWTDKGFACCAQCPLMESTNLRFPTDLCSISCSLSLSLPPINSSLPLPLSQGSEFVPPK